MDSSPETLASISSNIRTPCPSVSSMVEAMSAKRTRLNSPPLSVLVFDVPSITSSTSVPLTSKLWLSNIKESAGNFNVFKYPSSTDSKDTASFFRLKDICLAKVESSTYSILKNDSNILLSCSIFSYPANSFFFKSL